MFKQQGKKGISYATGLTLYNLLLIGVYPSISNSLGLAKLSLDLPDSVRRVFGVSAGSGLDRFESYAVNQCFGRIWMLVMGLYSVSTAEDLIAKLVDQGAMAYLLSSPTGRLEVLSTQVAVLVSGLAVMILLTEVGIWGEMRLFAIPVNIWPYIHLGVLEFALFLAVGSYSLFFSALFNDQGYANFCAAGLTFICYSLDVLAGLEERFTWLKNLTIFGWGCPKDVLEGVVPIMQVLALLGFSAIFIILAAYIFKQKDLPI